MSIGVAHAACDPEKMDQLHYDPEAKKTCVPCNYKHFITPAQKQNEHCVDEPEELTTQRDNQ